MKKLFCIFTILLGVFFTQNSFAQISFFDTCSVKEGYKVKCTYNGKAAVKYLLDNIDKEDWKNYFSTSSEGDNISLMYQSLLSGLSGKKNPKDLYNVANLFDRLYKHNKGEKLLSSWPTITEFHKVIDNKGLYKGLETYGSEFTKEYLFRVKNTKIGDLVFIDHEDDMKYDFVAMITKKTSNSPEGIYLTYKSNQGKVYKNIPLTSITTKRYGIYYITSYKEEL